MNELLLGWVERHLSDMGEDLQRVIPEEGCGLVVKSNGFRWMPLENTLHSPNAYAIAPRDWLCAEIGGETVCVIVHSHVDCTDTWSSRDRATAMVRDTHGKIRAAFPNVDYLVFSIVNGEWRAASIYRFDKGLEDFVRIRRWMNAITGN